MVGAAGCTEATEDRKNTQKLQTATRQLIFNHAAWSVAGHRNSAELLWGKSEWWLNIFSLWKKDRWGQNQSFSKPSGKLQVKGDLTFFKFGRWCSCGAYWRQQCWSCPRPHVPAAPETPLGDCCCRLLSLFKRICCFSPARVQQRRLSFTATITARHHSR